MIGKNSNVIRIYIYKAVLFWLEFFFEEILDRKLISLNFCFRT